MFLLNEIGCSGLKQAKKDETKIHKHIPKEIMQKSEAKNFRPQII